MKYAPKTNKAMNKSGLKGHFPEGGGGSLKTGLATRESIDSNPDSEGMCTKGPNQLPMPMPKTKAKGPFTFA